MGNEVLLTINLCSKKGHYWIAKNDNLEISINTWRMKLYKFVTKPTCHLKN